MALSGAEGPSAASQGPGAGVPPPGLSLDSWGTPARRRRWRVLRRVPGTAEYRLCNEILAWFNTAFLLVGADEQGEPSAAEIVRAHRIDADPRTLAMMIHATCKALEAWRITMRGEARDGASFQAVLDELLVWNEP